MLLMPIEPIPNQEFSIQLDDARFVIRLIDIQEGMMASSIQRNDEQITSHFRCVALRPLLLYRYQEGGFGNFAFETMNNEEPWWEKFNQSQFLWYASAEELKEIRSVV